MLEKIQQKSGEYKYFEKILPEYVVLIKNKKLI